MLTDINYFTGRNFREGKKREILEGKKREILGFIFGNERFNPFQVHLIFLYSFMRRNK